MAGYSINGLWGANSNRMWAVTGSSDVFALGGQILFWDGATWAVVAGSASYPLMTAVYGLPDESSVFVVGYQSQFYQIQGMSVASLENPGDGPPSNLSVWASAANSVWIATNTDTFALMHWAGSYFSNASGTTPSEDIGRAVFGFAANDVWTADASGTLSHYDGQTWTQSYSIELDGIANIYGVASNDVWATGSHALLHYDGKNWTELAAGKDAGLYAVWAAASNDVWAVGARGQILHGNATGFTSVPSGVTADLYTVWGTGPHDIWAGGADGTLLHYEPVNSPIPTSDAGSTCKTQGQTCGATGVCCYPFRCAAFASSLLVCE